MPPIVLYYLTPSYPLGAEQNARELCLNFKFKIMNILRKKLSIEEFKEYVLKKDFGKIPPSFIVLHHTWKPTKQDWNGLASIDAMKKYYEAKGWSAGPHLYVAEDGVYLFTDMYDVGIHAGAGNGDLKNGYSIGIEVVGDYDTEIWSGKTKSNTVETIKILQYKLNIPDSKIMFHRDYSTRTCPGKAITKDWVIKQLKEEQSMIKEFVKAVEKIAGKDYGDNLNEKEQKEAAKKLIKYRDKAEDNVSLIVAQQEKIEKQAAEINRLAEKYEQEKADHEITRQALEKSSGIYKLAQDIKRKLTNLWNLIG